MPKKNSAEYWAERAGNCVWDNYNSMEDKNRRLIEFYQDASDSIRDELYKLAEKYSRNGVLSLSDMYKKQRLTKLNQQYIKIVYELTDRVEDFSVENMEDGFNHVYGNLGQMIASDRFSMPNQKLMEELLERPWQGNNFSGRLWGNQKKLAVGLNNILLTGLQQGKTVVEIAVGLNNFMGKGFNAAHRLVRTESIHYLNSAALQRYADAGIRKVQIRVAADERTCEHCMQYHGKIYDIDKVPILPMHPNCRCVYLPVVDVENHIESGIIASGATKEVKDVYIIGKINRDIYRCITNDIITDEVIITDNQIQHIIERHPESYQKSMDNMKRHC